MEVTRPECSFGQSSNRYLALDSVVGTLWLGPFSCAILVLCVGSYFLRVVLSGRSAAWLARLVRDQEVEGSNPFAPTTFSLNDS